MRIRIYTKTATAAASHPSRLPRFSKRKRLLQSRQEVRLWDGLQKKIQKELQKRLKEVMSYEIMPLHQLIYVKHLDDVMTEEDHEEDEVSHRSMRRVMRRFFVNFQL